MQIINISKGGVESGLEGAVIAIGNFDGVHLGHQGIIEAVKQKAKALKKPAGILTFEPSPYAFFKVEEHYQLTSLKQKAKILEKMGLDFVAYADFNEKLAATNAEEFVRNYLVGKLKVSKVFTGDDFRFGNKAAGDSALLSRMASELGFEYTAIQNITGPEGEKYRSSAVRGYLMEGKVAEAANIMGRNFEIEGEVIKGHQRGRTIGFPTANIDMGHYFLPKFGVYEVVVRVQSSEFRGVANIGVKPTVSGDNKPVLEVHIPNFTDDIYGKIISVKLLSFVREEKKFASIEELKRQIEKDVGFITK